MDASRALADASGANGEVIYNNRLKRLDLRFQDVRSLRLRDRGDGSPTGSGPGLPLSLSTAAVRATAIHLGRVAPPGEAPPPCASDHGSGNP